MSYSTCLQRLFTVNVFGGIKLGLQNALRLQTLLNFPDRSFLTIHVAGTNGKGSVSTKIAYALEKAGYRVGLYTSPHLSCFRERICINREMISEEAIEIYLSQLFELCDREKLPATFFELTTFLAFQYFAAQKVDVAVLETGLGGRLDATNIITPCLSVITSISLDHTEVLGSTIEAIAREKGGIIKPGIPVVIGPNVPYSVMAEISAKNQTHCQQVSMNFSSFEEENQAIAAMALKQLKSRFKLSETVIQKAVIEGKQPCRFEIVKKFPFIILDVAHNPDGLMHLFQALQLYAPGKSLRLLFGLSKSKDVTGCLKLMVAHGNAFHLVEAPNGRGVPVEELQALMQHQEVESTRVFSHKSIPAGVHFAKQEAETNNQLLIICGSFFIMKEARLALGYQEPCDLMDLNERHAVSNLH